MAGKPDRSEAWREDAEEDAGKRERRRRPLEAAEDFDPRIVRAAKHLGMEPDVLIDLCLEHGRKVRRAMQETWICRGCGH